MGKLVTDGRRIVKPVKTINKEFSVPGDKSITHRAVMFNAMAAGEATVTGGLMGEDCLATINCMRALGAEIEIIDNAGRTEKPEPESTDKCSLPQLDFVKPDTGGNDSQNTPVIKIRGANKFKDNVVLDCGNSGTTMRLLAGILAGAGLHATLTGDESLSRRPMKRVTEPLKRMGADISDTEGHAPLIIRPAHLKGIEFENTTGSAQVKSAVLLAGLSAGGVTTVREKTASRNHTEIMLREMGADLTETTDGISVKRSAPVCRDINVPGDISSAAFLWAAGAILFGSPVTVKNVGINETRAGILRVLEKMGAEIKIENARHSGEPVADVTVRYKKLKGILIGEDEPDGTCNGGLGKSCIPALIDELPVIAVLAAFAEGRTVIKNATELKVKETDRIKAMAENLTRMGADITATDDGWIIEGKGGAGLAGGAEVDSFGDHRIAMAMTIAAMCSRGGAVINNADCVNISFPGFWEVL